MVEDISHNILMNFYHISFVKGNDNDNFEKTRKKGVIRMQTVKVLLELHDCNQVQKTFIH
jgi:hypothetical protein